MACKHLCHSIAYFESIRYWWCPQSYIANDDKCVPEGTLFSTWFSWRWYHEHIDMLPTITLNQIIFWINSIPVTCCALFEDVSDLRDGEVFSSIICSLLHAEAVPYTHLESTVSGYVHATHTKCIPFTLWSNDLMVERIFYYVCSFSCSSKFVAFIIWIFWQSHSVRNIHHSGCYWLVKSTETVDQQKCSEYNLGRWWGFIVVCSKMSLWSACFSP